MQEDNSNVPQILTALFAAAFVLGIILICMRNHVDKEFLSWFEEVKKQAPYYGFTEEDIDDFDMWEWEQLFFESLKPEEAIKQFLSENK